MKRLRYAAMPSKPAILVLCFFCAALCAGCSDREATARYEGIDPGGQRVEVALYVPPFTAATPVCLAPAEPAAAEMKINARPPAATGRVVLYLARRHYSQCGAEAFPTVVYWETTAQGPEACFYRIASRAGAAIGSDVIGEWDYCALLQPYRD